MAVVVGFPDVGSVISPGVELVEECRVVRRYATIVAPHAVVVGVKRVDEGGPGRHAHGADRRGLCEANPFGRDAIHIRCPYLFMPGT
jgi:hypothetical protein